MTGNFVGKYVPEVVHVVTTSAVTGVHSLICGSPGKGKTSIARAVVGHIYQPDEWGFIRCTPTMSPEPITGMFDPGPMMESPPRLVIEKKGSAYDPNFKMVILDEITRPSDPVLELLVDVLDRWDVAPDEAPVVVGTANFIRKTERLEAVFDRIPIVYWIPDGVLNVKDVVMAQMDSIGARMDVQDSLPDAKTIADVRAARPTQRAKETVSGFLEVLVKMAHDGIQDSSGNVTMAFNGINERRLSLWNQILFRMSVLETGTADFDKIPHGAIKSIQYAWPSSTESEFKAWVELTGGVADPVQAAIDAAMRMAYDTLQEQSVNFSGSAEDRRKGGLELGRVLQKNIAPDLEAIIGREDPRYAECMETLQAAIYTFVSGKEISDV